MFSLKKKSSTITVASFIEGLLVNGRAKIHQPLVSQFSLLAEFFIGKVPVRNI
jgi:hypothetical protein